MHERETETETERERQRPLWGGYACRRERERERERETVAILAQVAWGGTRPLPRGLEPRAASFKPLNRTALSLKTPFTFAR